MLKHIKPFVPAQMLQPIKDKLQNYQNRAARIIADASYEIRSADVFQTPEWENLESRRFITKATLMYKILNDHSAQNLKSY